MLKVKKKKEYSFKTPFCLILLAVIYTVLVTVVDVAPIGPMNSEVGFSHINGYFAGIFGFNGFWYELTQLLGYLSLAVVAAYGFIGLVELVKRKSLLKVDRNLIITGVYFVAVLAVYVLFEKIEINYRPIILDEGLEASYPSSHTVLICSVMSAAVMRLGDYISNRKLVKMIGSIGLLLIPVTVVGRMLSGVHWFTDIVGGVVISAALVFIYKWAIECFGKSR